MSWLLSESCLFNLGFFFLKEQILQYIVKLHMENPPNYFRWKFYLNFGTDLALDPNYRKYTEYQKSLCVYRCVSINIYLSLLFQK